MTSDNSQNVAPALTGSDILWAGRCGLWGGILVGLPVALAAKIEYPEAALGCGMAMFVAAVIVLALRSIGGTVGTLLARLVFGLLMTAIFIGFLSFVGLKLYCEFGQPTNSSSTTYNETFEPAVIGSN